ncbi:MULTISPECIES: hypothetical protein [Rhodopseudomonas]|uniref:hypothetical protein n=1 Tax=Rhodopseudomonas TaxID=1073 RepID=UPI00128DB562|nr:MULTISPECIES: hypothetical protein [Rhodopseudomonas]MDF3812314.1 hypothetical protein [Rhodopseudomonas sp. BAL398]WOK18180.1 hypothetical protein RBJ75_01240 [Rhodopseudomonas sp. BAL398]
MKASANRGLFCSLNAQRSDCRGAPDCCYRRFDMIIHRGVAEIPAVPVETRMAASPGIEATKLVCAALLLAIVALASGILTRI